MLKLNSKNSLTIKKLAKEFLSISENERIKTITEYSEIINVARGTIQNSLKVLIDDGAIEIQSKGHLGSFLIKKDFQKLLNFADIKFIAGVMPLPYSKRYEGLSTGILSEMESKLNIPVNMSYMRGARKRIEMVIDERYDFAITSKYAALEYIKENNDIEIIIEFGEHSFLSKHLLITLDKHFTEIKDGMRVGIDYASIDQSKLTLNAINGKNVKLIEINYNLLIQNLLDLKIDLAIWNGDEVQNKYENVYLKDINEYNDDNTIAVLLVKKDRNDLKKIIKDSINIDKILEIQNLVIENKIIPSY